MSIDAKTLSCYRSNYDLSAWDAVRYVGFPSPGACYAIYALCNEVESIQNQRDELLEQVECATIVNSNLEGRLNNMVVKLAFMEMRRDYLLSALEFARDKISELHLEAGDGDFHYPIINYAIASVKGES